MHVTDLRKFPFLSSLLDIFKDKWVLDFVQIFSNSLKWLYKFSTLICQCSQLHCLISNTKTNWIPMDKPHLVMLNDPFYMLVYSIFKYSLKNFALSSCNIFLLQCFPPVNPLMGFCISVIKWVLEVFSHSLYSKKKVYCFFFNCLIKFISEPIWTWVFLIINSQNTSLIFLTDIGLFRYSISICVNFGKLCLCGWSYLHKAINNILSSNSI